MDGGCDLNNFGSDRAKRSGISLDKIEKRRKSVFKLLRHCYCLQNQFKIWIVSGLRMNFHLLFSRLVQVSARKICTSIMYFDTGKQAVSFTVSWLFFSKKTHFQTFSKIRFLESDVILSFYCEAGRSTCITWCLHKTLFKTLKLLKFKEWIKKMNRFHIQWGFGIFDESEHCEEGCFWGCWHLLSVPREMFFHKF